MHLSQISLALTRIGRVVSDPDAVIKALFASGEQGAWYDPSDFSTMFQNSTGTTPVTAVGQTVGLILDKSKGLVLGSELVDTANSPSGWSAYGSNTVTAAGANTVKITYGGGTSSEFGAAIFLTATGGLASDLVGGKTYLVEFQAKNTGDVSIKFAYNVTYINIPVTSSYVTYSVYINQIGTYEPYIVLNANFSTGEEFWIRNISVKEIAGNHAIQETYAALPVLANNANTKPYRNFDGVDDSMGTTFASSLGSSCTVARSDPSTGASILTAQTIGTSYSASADDCALIIVNRALTTQETTDVTAWLNGKAGV